MTRHQSFKRLVRTRMAKTGESYTAARATLLAAREPDAGPRPALATSDEMIRQRTGRGWEEWFDLLDEAGLAERPHRDIARWVAELLGVVPLAWAAQAVTVSYERARGGRAVGQRPDGFAITASKTVGIPVGRLFGAFAGEAERGRWLADAELRERSATKPRSARFDWGDGRTRPGPRPDLVDRVPGRALDWCHRAREHPVAARSDTRGGLAREAARGRRGRQRLAVDRVR